MTTPGPYLVFCSFEVGGIPFDIARLLNQQGRRTLYASVATQKGRQHDSTAFHFPGQTPEWDVSARFQGALGSASATAGVLRALAREYGITRCFATGVRSWLLARAGIRYKYWCYGSDLDQSCFRPVWPEGYPLWKRPLIRLLFLLTTRREARLTLDRAEGLLIAPYQKPVLDKLLPGKPLFWLPHRLAVAPWEDTLRLKAQAREAVAKTIGPGRFVFSATRHVWKGALASQTDNKGNDTLLLGFAHALKRAHDTDLRLVLVNKGPDAEATRQMARQLGMAERVVWLEEMPRSELSAYYAAADACLGQFRTPVLTYSALEPLAFGTPVASLFADAPGVPGYEQPPPLLNTNSPERIGAWLLERGQDDQLSEASWRWAWDNCTEPRFADAFDRAFSAPEGEPR